MKRFTATLEGEGPGGAWTVLRVPFDVLKEFGGKARVSVRGTINDFAYRSSIFPNGKGPHFMMVNKAMRAGAKVNQGQTVRVTMEVDDAPRIVSVPADLKKALKAHTTAKKFFDGLAPSCKKEYVEWIVQAKRDPTRKGRVAKAMAMLAQGKKRG
jgi:hypothetical protein